MVAVDLPLKWIYVVAGRVQIWDYLMRHDRSMCMTMGTLIPYGNAPWFRWLLGWLLPPQVSTTSTL